MITVLLLLAFVFNVKGTDDDILLEFEERDLKRHKLLVKREAVEINGPKISGGPVEPTVQPSGSSSGPAEMHIKTVKDLIGFLKKNTGEDREQIVEFLQYMVSPLTYLSSHK